ncbi:uncharacterized protein [Lepeophtheirus salmonis]|nr:uncharacterized protein LOC121114486 [Lepeophtheirus salmonis]
MKSAMVHLTLTLFVISSFICSNSATNYNSDCVRKAKDQYSHSISDVILSLRTSNLKNCVKSCQFNRLCNSLSFSNAHKPSGKNCFLSGLSSDSIHYRAKPKKSWNVYVLIKNDEQGCGKLGPNINLSQTEEIYKRTERTGCFKALRYGYSFNSSTKFLAKNRYECLIACKRALTSCQTLSFISNPYEDELMCIWSSNTISELQERLQIFGETYGEILSYIEDCHVSQTINKRQRQPKDLTDSSIHLS